MHQQPRKLAAVLTACLMLLTAAPAAAESTGGAQDRNGDGVIDIFDYVIAKRASVDDNSPISITMTGAEGAPGDVVSIDVFLNDNTGFTALTLGLEYPEALSPADDDKDASTQLNQTRFGDLQPSCVVFPEANTVLYTTTRRCLNTENGKLFSVSFKIPEDAAPGTVYTLSFTSPEMRGETQSALPLLTGKGKITVSPDAAVTTAPVVEIFAPPTATTAVTSTTAASSATVPAVTTEVTAAPTETTTTTTALTVAPYLYHGIDISAWQKGADFSKIAEDPQVDFVILRAGYGKYLKQKDECFDSFYNDAKKYNIPVGAYWYSYAMTPEEARLEADICAQAIAGKQFEYPIAFDIEEPKQLALPVEEVSALIDAFCSEMEKKGYYAQVYCSSFYLNTRVNNYVKERYDVWCAHYNVKRPTFTGKYNIWQYSCTGTVSGIPGDCDLDYCYRDYPEVIKRLHFNGF